MPKPCLAASIAAPFWLQCKRGNTFTDSFSWDDSNRQVVEGSTVDDLEKGFKYMVDEHIKDCEKNNIPIEKSYKGNLNIRLSPDLHKKAAYNASMRGISLNQYINEAIKKEIASSDPD